MKEPRSRIDEHARRLHDDGAAFDVPGPDPAEPPAFLTAPLADETPPPAREMGERPPRRRRRRPRRQLGPVVLIALGAAFVTSLVAAAIVFRPLWLPLLDRPAGVVAVAPQGAPVQPPGVSLDRPASGLAGGSQAPAVPGPPNLGVAVILIRDVLVALDHANETNNYTVLRDIASSRFQQANSAARLSEAFAAIRARNLDLLPALTINPRLEQEPIVDEDGDLVLRGSFPSSPEQLDFVMAFNWSGSRWRLFSLSVDTSPNPDNSDIPGAEEWPELRSRPTPATGPAAAGQPEMPSGYEMVALVRDTNAAVNQANRTGNYAVLRETAAPAFQASNPHVRLMQIFANLRRGGTDLSPILAIDPELFRPPAIDERGLLRLTGYFPSRPEQVNYDLLYQLVGDTWRLFGVSVGLAPPPAAEGAAQGPSVPGGSSAPAAQAPPAP